MLQPSNAAHLSSVQSDQLTASALSRNQSFPGTSSFLGPGAPPTHNRPVRENRKKPSVFGFNMCHQCRRNESTDDLIRCLQESCPNYFCFNCIKKGRQKKAQELSNSTYSQSVFPKAEFLKLKDSQSFACPQCLGQCPCSQCSATSHFNDLKEIQMVGIYEDFAALEGGNVSTKDETAKMVRGNTGNKGTPTESKDQSKNGGGGGSSSEGDDKAPALFKQKELVHEKANLRQEAPWQNAQANFNNNASSSIPPLRSGFSKSLLYQAVAQIQGGVSQHQKAEYPSSSKVVLQLAAHASVQGSDAQFKKNADGFKSPSNGSRKSSEGTPGQKLDAPTYPQHSYKTTQLSKEAGPNSATEENHAPLVLKDEKIKDCKVVLHLNSNMAQHTQTSYVQEARSSTIQIAQDQEVCLKGKETILDPKDAQGFSCKGTIQADGSNITPQVNLAPSTLIRFPILKVSGADPSPGGYKQSPQKNQNFHPSTQSGISVSQQLSSHYTSQETPQISANQQQTPENKTHPGQEVDGTSNRPAQSQGESLQGGDHDSHGSHVANFEGKGLQADIKQDSIMQALTQENIRQQEQRLSIGLINGSIQQLPQKVLQSGSQIDTQALIQTELIEDISCLVGEKRTFEAFRSGANLPPVHSKSSQKGVIPKTDSIRQNLGINSELKINEDPAKRKQLDPLLCQSSNQEPSHKGSGTESPSEEEEEIEEDDLEDSDSSSYNEGKTTKLRDSKGAHKRKNIKNCLMYDQVRRKLLRAAGAHDVSEKYVKIQKLGANTLLENNHPRLEISHDSSKVLLAQNDLSSNQKSSSSGIDSQNQIVGKGPINENAQAVSAFIPFTSMQQQKFPKMQAASTNANQLNPNQLPAALPVQSVNSPQGVLGLRQNAPPGFLVHNPSEQTTYVVPHEKQGSLLLNQQTSSLRPLNSVNNSAIIQPQFMRATTAIGQQQIVGMQTAVKNANSHLGNNCTPPVCQALTPLVAGLSTTPNPQIAQLIMTQNGPVQIQVQNAPISNGVSISNQHQISGPSVDSLSVKPMHVINSHQVQQNSGVLHQTLMGLELPNYGQASMQSQSPQVINLTQQSGAMQQQIIGYTAQGQAVIGYQQQPQQIILPQGVNVAQNQIFQVGPGGQLIPISTSQSSQQQIPTTFGQQTSMLQQVSSMSPNQGSQEVVTQIGYLDPATGEIKLLQGGSQPIILHPSQRQQNQHTATIIHQHPSQQRGPGQQYIMSANHQSGGLLDQGQSSQINAQNTQFHGGQVILNSGQLQALQSDQLLPPSLVQQFGRQMSNTSNGQVYKSNGIVQDLDHSGLNMILGQQQSKQGSGIIVTHAPFQQQQQQFQRQPGVMVLQNLHQNNEQSNHSAQSHSRILSQTNLLEQQSNLQYAVNKQGQQIQGYITSNGPYQILPQGQQTQYQQQFYTFQQ